MSFGPVGRFQADATIGRWESIRGRPGTWYPLLFIYKIPLLNGSETIQVPGEIDSPNVPDNFMRLSRILSGLLEASSIFASSRLVSPRLASPQALPPPTPTPTRPPPQSKR